MFRSLAVSLMGLFAINSAFAIQPWCTKSTDSIDKILSNQKAWLENIKLASHAPYIKFNQDLLFQAVLNNSSNKYVRETRKTSYKRSGCNIDVIVTSRGDQKKSALIKKGAVLSYREHITDIYYSPYYGTFQLDSAKVHIEFSFRSDFTNDCSSGDLSAAARQAGFSYGFFHPEDAKDCQIETPETEVISTLEQQQTENASQAM